MEKSLLPMPVKNGGLIYLPEERNMDLRLKIEDYMTIYDSRHEPPILLTQSTIRSTSGMALTFLIVMIAILSITLMFW